MGKALPKICSVCSAIISGANWAKHAWTHGGNIPYTIYKGAAVVKTGRPRKEPKRHHFDTPKNARLITLRGPIMAGYKRNPIEWDLEYEKLCRWVRG
jgi:hypothetical protein